MVYQKQVFPWKHPPLYIRMRARLSVLRSLVPIARITHGMGVEYDAMGEMKEVHVLVTSLHIV